MPDESETYYYGACVDSVEGETVTSNNCSTGVRVVVVDFIIVRPNPSVPDLIVNSPSVSKSSLAVGGTFTLNATVHNQGTGTAAATTLRYYRSSDSTITRGDTSVSTDDVVSLPASATSSQLSISVEPDVSETYYYGACVDSVSLEENTSNNCSTGVSVVVTSAQVPEVSVPDLIVNSPTVSRSSLSVGGTFTLNATVHNQGTGTAAATTLRYYRSSDSMITRGDTSVSTRGRPVIDYTDDVASLPASATSLEKSNVLPAPSQVGTYYYGACVDSVEGETAMDNNCSTGVRVVVIQVPAPTSPDVSIPDLSFSDFEIDADFVTGGRYRSDGSSVRSPTVETGEKLTLSVTVINLGDATAHGIQVIYYMDDIAKGQDSISFGLAAGADNPESFKIDAPSSDGTYYYHACVRQTFRVNNIYLVDTNMDNNCTNRIGIRVADAKVSLHVELSVTDFRGVVGEKFKLNAVVYNRGNVTAHDITVTYYMDGTEIGDDNISSLAGGADNAESLKIRDAPSIGTYTYRACLSAAEELEFSRYSLSSSCDSVTLNVCTTNWVIPCGGVVGPTVGF